MGIIFVFLYIINKQKLFKHTEIICASYPSVYELQDNEKKICFLLFVIRPDSRQHPGGGSTQGAKNVNIASVAIAQAQAAQLQGQSVGYGSQAQQQQQPQQVALFLMPFHPFMSY